MREDHNTVATVGDAAEDADMVLVRGRAHEILKEVQGDLLMPAVS